MEAAARVTHGFVGADLKVLEELGCVCGHQATAQAVCREAAMAAVNRTLVLPSTGKHCVVAHVHFARLQATIP